MSDQVGRERVGGVEIANPPLPAGWLWAIAAGGFLAIGTWFWLAIFAAPGSLDRYLDDRAAALDTGALLSEETLLELAGDPLALRAGERAYAEHCATCHGQDAEGDEGPSLVDSDWVAQSAPLDIYQTVVEGRRDKGMPAWGSLGPGTCMQVTAYLLTIRQGGVNAEHETAERDP